MRRMTRTVMHMEHEKIAETAVTGTTNADGGRGGRGSGSNNGALDRREGRVAALCVVVCEKRAGIQSG